MTGFSRDQIIIRPAFSVLSESWKAKMLGGTSQLHSKGHGMVIAKQWVHRQSSLGANAEEPLFKIPLLLHKRSLGEDW